MLKDSSRWLQHSGRMRALPPSQRLNLQLKYFAINLKAK